MSSRSARAAGPATARKREAERAADSSDSEHEPVENPVVNSSQATQEMWRTTLAHASENREVRGTVARAARYLGVKDSTFRYHLDQYEKTGVVHRTDHGPECTLGPVLEEETAGWVGVMGGQYMPPTIPLLKAKAKELARANGIDDSKVGGESWWKGFRARHPDVVLRMPQEVDSARISAPTTENLTVFYDHVALAYKVHFPGGTPDATRIYNMDETMLSVKNSRQKVSDRIRTTQRNPLSITSSRSTN